jgi:hypothetical protein
MGKGIEKACIEKQVEIVFIQAEEFGGKRDHIAINGAIDFQEVYLSGSKAVYGIVLQFIFIYINKMNAGAIFYPYDDKIAMTVGYFILLEPVLGNPLHGMDLEGNIRH